MGAKIVITPEMIQAGVKALLLRGPSSELFCEAEEIVQDVFCAMSKAAKRPPDMEQHQ